MIVQCMVIASAMAVQTTGMVPKINLYEAAESAAAAIVFQQEPSVTHMASRVEDGNPETYFGSLAEGFRSPAALAFMGASVAQIVSNQATMNTCRELGLTCSSAGADRAAYQSLLTGAVYMGMEGAFQLIERQWDVEIHDTWKEYLFYGALTALQLVVTVDQLQVNQDLARLR